MGRPGELNERLLDVVEQPGPQLRAVATTLLIKALDVPGEERRLIDAMVSSDAAAAMIDPVAAATAGLDLRTGLMARLDRLADEHDEPSVVRSMRDHLRAQVERWASRAVDNAENRRRAERFLAWAERPGQLEAAQRRGLFIGMDTDELRHLADTQTQVPVAPETALGIWSQVDDWMSLVRDRLGDPVLALWRDRARDAT